MKACMTVGFCLQRLPAKRIHLMHELRNGAIFVQQHAPSTSGKEKNSLRFPKISADSGDGFSADANQKAIAIEEPLLGRLHCISYKASNIHVTIWPCLAARIAPAQDDPDNVVVVELSDECGEELFGQWRGFVLFLKGCLIGHVCSP